MNWTFLILRIFEFLRRYINKFDCSKHCPNCSMLNWYLCMYHVYKHCSIIKIISLCIKISACLWLSRCGIGNVCDFRMQEHWLTEILSDHMSEWKRLRRRKIGERIRWKERVNKNKFLHKLENMAQSHFAFEHRSSECQNQMLWHS